jgi:hypothetical protein
MRKLSVVWSRVRRRWKRVAEEDESKRQTTLLGLHKQNGVLTGNPFSKIIES